MQYRQLGKLNLKPSLLGFGMMRLPILNNDQSKIDIPEAIKMVRYAIDNGVNYIDTAWGYHKEQSEIFTGMALKDGYREKVILATKSPTWFVKKPEDWDNLLDQQLKKLDTDYIDCYLQHSLNYKMWLDIKEMGIWDRAMKAKEAGKIRYFGFSFHDSFEAFSEILDTYDWDFCQIQLNYLDADYQAGLKGLEKAASKNIGVIIMEPLRGGRLVNGLPEDLAEEMRAFKPKRTPAEWAFKWLANHPGISIILSGMSTMEQIKDNIRIFSSPDFLPKSMSAAELSFIDGIASKWKAKKLINCTGCNYCMPCPNGVDIPGCFKDYNYLHSAMADAGERSAEEYKKKIESNSDASQCVECGLCQSVCPQNISIIDNLKVLDKELVR